MPGGAGPSYNGAVSDAAQGPEGAEAGDPVAPIPLPQDPMSRWLDPRASPVAGKDDGDGSDEGCGTIRG
jgi:hypothetical protein